MLDFAMAWYLLLTPPNEIEHIEETLIADNREALRQLALDLEILDQRELRYILPDTPNYLIQDLRNDVHLLADRYEKFKNIPKMGSAPQFCFSTKEELSDKLRFNRDFRRFLENQKNIFDDLNPGLYDKVIKETDYLYRFWDKVKDYNCEYYYITVRRDGLKNIVEEMKLLKMEFWDEPPPIIPMWRLAK